MIPNGDPLYLMSVMAPTAVKEIILYQYGFKNIIYCELLRSFVNDVYEIVADNNKYILKLYRQGHRTKKEIDYEIALLRFVDSKGVKVSTPIPIADDSYVGKVEAPEGTRYFSLFNYASGSKPKKPFTDELYVNTGRTLANYHTVSLKFSCGYGRETYLAHDVIDNSMPLIYPYLNEKKDMIKEIVNVIGKRINEYEKYLTKVVCHGDYSLDNLHIDQNNVIEIYDFDSCGPGYAAYDLLGAYMVGKELKRWSNWTSHLDGYKEICPLNEYDLLILPELKIIYDLWGLGCNVKLWKRFSGLWQVTGYSFQNTLEEICIWYDKECK